MGALRVSETREDALIRRRINPQTEEGEDRSADEEEDFDPQMTQTDADGEEKKPSPICTEPSRNPVRSHRE
jgi:hypothetical protein